MHRGIGATLLGLMVYWASAAMAAEFDPSRPTALITGANRGIGYAFAEHYARAGWNVIATARTPETADELRGLADRYPQVAIEQLDVTDAARISGLAEAYADQPVDLLINNAGIYGDRPGQTWGSLDANTFEQVMAVNVFAPLKMAEAFADHIARSRQKKIVSLTSGVSSIELGRGASDGLIYSISKTALNMAMRKAAMALQPRDIIVALIAPGMVDTDMLAQSRPGVTSGTSPAAAVARMSELIDGLDETYDGRPITAEGERLPW